MVLSIGGLGLGDAEDSMSEVEEGLEIASRKAKGSSKLDTG